MKRNLPIIFVLIFCFVFRVMLTPYGTFGPDLGTFVDWSNRVNKMGFSGFYSEWSDYLPGYIYVLWFLGKVRVMLPPTFTNELLYKLPSIITDVITIYLIYLIVLKFKNRRWAIMGAFIYGISPSIFGNSALWGQVDSSSTLPILLSAYFLLRCNLNKGYTLLISGLFMGVAFVLKPSGVFLLPLFLIYIILIKKNVKDILVFILPAILLFLLAFVPFSGEKNFFPFVIERVQKSINQHSATCLNSYNFWMIAEGCWKDASGKFLNFSLRQWGVVLFSISYLSILSNLRKIRKENLPLSVGIIFFSGFLFLTGIHERHIFPVFAFLAIAACFRKRLWLAYFIIVAVSYLNLGYAQAWFAQKLVGIYSPSYVKLSALTNVLVWAYLMLDFVKGVANDKT